MSQIIDGKAVANQLRLDIKQKIIKLKVEPCLCVILIGNNPASEIYVKNKEKVCKECGIKSIKYQLQEQVEEQDVLQLIEKLNLDKSINGILVQLPLPKHLNERKILNSILPEKDVDGFHNINAGKLFIGQELDNLIIPCTAEGCLLLIESLNLDLNGKKAVVIGRSNIVGKPISALLLNKNCTISLLHSRTKNNDFLYETTSADLLIVGIGKPCFIKSNMIKSNCVIIDVGINRVNGKVCGDVDFEDVKDKCGFISPVPGGVGPMTVACLMKNTLKCFLFQNNL